MLTDRQKLEIACALVRAEISESEVLDDTVKIAVRGITLGKLLDLTQSASLIYRERKRNKERADFEQILEDTILLTFTTENARHVAKHVLGHFFAWRRNKCMPKEAHDVARDLGMTFI